MAEATAQADSLRAYTEFAALQQARTRRSTSLAQSRFDWERVLRELAIVIPEDVWLLKLTGTANPAVQLCESGPARDLGASPSVPGPAIGDRRLRPRPGWSPGSSPRSRTSTVSPASRSTGSERPDPSSAAEGTTGGGSGGASEDCATRSFISKFGIVAAFDAVQVGASTEATEAPPATSEPTASASADSAADQSQVSDGQQQLEEQKQSSARQTGKARDDGDTFIPGTATAP